MCVCRTEAETTEHFLLPCHFYNTESLSAKSQVYILFYGFQTRNSKSLNHEILIKFYVPH